MRLWLWLLVLLDLPAKSILTQEYIHFWVLFWDNVFVCTGNWFLCLNVCAFLRANSEPYCNHSFDHRENHHFSILQAEDLEMLTNHCWRFWVQVRGLVAERSPACPGWWQLAWERRKTLDWPWLAWLDKTDDRADTRTCHLNCRVFFPVSVHQQNSF